MASRAFAVPAALVVASCAAGDAGELRRGPVAGDDAGEDDALGPSPRGDSDASAPPNGDDAPPDGRASGPEGGAAEGPGIQYFGRWDFGDPAKPSASWGAVYLKARFEGTSVAIRLEDADAFAPGNDYEYSVDGAPVTVLSPSGSAVYPLAGGLPDGVHTLELYRRTEGSYGKTVVGGLVLDPGKGVLAPPPRPPHRIEIVGDSISAGFGDEGHGGSDRHTQNGAMAFGPQLARLLQAEWSVIAHSGRGLYRNLGEQPPLAQPHMPDEFRLKHFLTSNELPGPSMTDALWNFDSWQPDAVVVALGTNDFAQPGPVPADSDFRAAYGRFLELLRSVYPSAVLFCMGTLIREDGYFGDQWAVCNRDVCDAAAAENAKGDDRVRCVDPCAQSPQGWLPDANDYIGDWTHPTAAGHTIIAQRLRDAIAPVMGW
jgi:lysophospholipase L1-like esterase